MTWKHKLTNSICVVLAVGCLVVALCFFVTLAWGLR